MSGDEALGFLDGLQGQMGARDLVNEGSRLFLAGDFTEAESKFKEAIALNPQNAVAHGNIGNICFKTGKYKEAIPWLEKALQLDPQLAGASDCLRECRSRNTTSQNPYQSVSSQETVPISLLDVACSYKGRLGQGPFFLYGLALNIASILLILVLATVLNVSENAGLILVGLLYLFFAIPALVKRMHDFNQSGFLVIGLFIMYCIPIINALAAIAMLAIPGTIGSNKYGEKTHFVFFKK